MAERQEVIRITLDTGDLKKQMVDREKDIKAAKDALAQLTVAIKENGTATEAQIQQELELQSTIRLLNKEQGNAKQNLDKYTISQKESTGSIKQLRAELSILTDAYNGLSQEQRENSEAGQALQKQIKGISDKLKEQEKAVGDTRRNVGNYRDGIKEAVQSSGLFANEIDKLTQIQDTFNGLLKITKTEQTATNAAIAAGGPASTVFANGMKLVKTALIATGLGAFVVILGSLIAFFQRTEEGAEKLERAMAGVGAVVDVLIGTVASLGKNLVTVFENPKQAIKDLGQFIIDNLVNRFKSFGVILNAIQNRDLKGVTDGFLQMATGIEDVTGKVKRFGDGVNRIGKEAAAAAANMIELTRRTQDLEDAQAAESSRILQQRGEMERLLATVKERTLSEQQRINNLKQAGAIEQDITRKELEFAREALAIAKQRDVLDKASGKLAEERSAETIAAANKVIEIENQSALQRQQIANRESVFIKELREERIRAAEEALKRQLESEKAAIQIRLVAAAKGSVDELAIREELLQKELEIEIKTGKLTKTQRLLAEAETNATILEARSKFFTELDSINLLEVKSNNDSRDEIIQKYGDQMNASKEAMEQQKADAKAIKEYEDKINQERIRGAYQLTDSIMETFDEQTLIYKAAFKLKQGLALAEQAMALPEILTANASTGAKISAIAPPVTIPLGIAYTVAADIAAGLKIAKMIADIGGIKIPGFYDGGYTTEGNPKEQARNLGAKPYIYHKSEYVAPHDVLAMPEGQYHVQKLEQLRLQKRGKIAVSNSYYVGGYANVPAPTREAINSTTAPDIDYDQLSRSMSKIKIGVSVTEINSKNANVARREAKVNN